MKICSQEISGCMIVVVLTQIVTWAVVSALLFYRGIYNLWNGRYDFNVTLVNRTSLQPDSSVIQGHSGGILIIIIASFMIIIGPVFLVAVIIEKCYRKHKFVKLPQDDLPPKYEDIMLEEMAPRYSSLFLNSGQDESTHT